MVSDTQSPISVSTANAQKTPERLLDHAGQNVLETVPKYQQQRCPSTKDLGINIFKLKVNVHHEGLKQFLYKFLRTLQKKNLL